MTLTCTSRELDTATDRRRDERFDDQRPVRLFEPFSGKYFPGMTCNVSSAGVCVRLPSTINLRPGRFVTLHDGDDRSMRIDRRHDSHPTARVVWVKIDPSDSRAVLVGLELYAATIAAAA